MTVLGARSKQLEENNTSLTDRVAKLQKMEERIEVLERQTNASRLKTQKLERELEKESRARSQDEPRLLKLQEDYKRLAQKFQELERKQVATPRDRLISKDDPRDIKVLSRRLDAMENRSAADTVVVKNLINRFEELHSHQLLVEKRDIHPQSRALNMPIASQHVSVPQTARSQATITDVSLPRSPVLATCTPIGPYDTSR